MKFTISFKENPPETFLTIPREYLGSILAGMLTFGIIVLLVAPIVLKVIILAILAGLAFAAYKMFMMAVGPEWEPHMDSFFKPSLAAFKENDVDIKRGQLTYLWNYNSVPLSFTKIARIDSKWNNQATVVIEDIDYKKLFTKDKLK